jgi:large subunit ribosomal protein L19
MQARGYTRETIRNIGVQDRKFPEFKVGDAIAVSTIIREGDKERIQVFEGDVICIRTNGISSSFTVRKIAANGVAVERVFPYYSPLIESIKFVSHGKVRRSKLFFMRNRIGKAARVEEMVLTKEQKEAARHKEENI